MDWGKIRKFDIKSETERESFIDDLVHEDRL